MFRKLGLNGRQLRETELYCRMREKRRRKGKGGGDGEGQDVDAALMAWARSYDAGRKKRKGRAAGMAEKANSKGKGSKAGGK